MLRWCSRAGHPMRVVWRQGRTVQTGRTPMKLVGLVVGLLLLSTAAAPVWAQAQSQAQPGRPMTGALDLRPGMVSGQVRLGRGSAAINAMLTDRGPDGTLSLAAPGTFAGTATVGNGALEV